MNSAATSAFARPMLLLAEQELTIQIGEVDRVHVNDVDVTKSQQSHIFQQLASQSTGTDQQDAAVVSSRKSSRSGAGS